MGVKDWIKRKGNTSKERLKETINYKEVAGTAQDIKGMAEVLLSPKEQIKKSKKETFQKAKERLKINDLDLIKVYKNYAYICYISLFFSLICFIGVMYNLIILHSIINALSMLSIMMLCLANAFKFSFRAFQIRHQKLCSVKEWWDRASEWLPRLNNK